MKLNIPGLILTLLTPVLVIGCGKSGKESYAADSIKIEITDTITELPLPDVPDSIKDPTERANYVVKRFWDKMNFRDTLLSHNQNFIEQNFSNYVGFAVYADSTTYIQSVKDLVKKAQVDPDAYALLMDVADLYLYQPESPMYSEEMYIPFLKEQLKYPFKNEEAKLKRQLQLEDASKNRPGMQAADFAFESREGKKMQLSKISPTTETLLIFYNPDCDHCKDVMKKLADSKQIKEKVKAGEMTVVAIYSGEDKTFWKESLDSMPSEWIVGYDAGKINYDGLYSIRVSPTIYILDKDKKVLIKDVGLEQLVEI